MQDILRTQQTQKVLNLTNKTNAANLTTVIHFKSRHTCKQIRWRNLGKDFLTR